MKYLIILISIFFYNFSNGQNCENLKTGTFTIKVKDVDCTVKRTKKKEIFSSKYGTVRFRIKWISNCEYILFKRRPKLKTIYGDLKIDDFNEKNDTLYYEVMEDNDSEFKVITSDRKSNYKFEYVYKKNNNR